MAVKLCCMNFDLWSRARLIYVPDAKTPLEQIIEHYKEQHKVEVYEVRTDLTADASNLNA